MPLHLWHTESLARDLASERVTEHEAMQYMLAGAVLYVQASYSALWFGAYRDWVFFLELVVVLAASLIGVNECFKANGGSEGRQFMTRLCALAVPVGIKIALLAVVLGQGFYYSSPYLLGRGGFRDPALVYRYVAMVMPIAFTFIYYWRIAYHLGTIRAMQTAKATSAL